MYTPNFFSVKPAVRNYDFGITKAFYPQGFEERYNTYVKYVLEHVKVAGLWLEFGVATGETTQKYVEFMPQSQKPLYGFDWFQGLPENWATYTAGTFSTQGVVPQITGTEMVVGLFADTLPKFIKEHKQDISVLILDADLYSSTKTILGNCKNSIVPGTIILFDEYHNGDGIYHDWEKHEHKAFTEFIQENNVKYQWLAYAANGEQAACVITGIDGKV